jgi:hypothetical protein
MHELKGDFMKKKIIAIALGLTLCLGMTRCTKGNIEPESSYFANKYIDLVTIYKDDYYNTEVLYDKNTKVMYFVKWSGYQFGITPIYNSDGTVKLYDG